MPGVLAAATVSPASTVLPQTLSTVFAHVHVYPLLSVQYSDGTVERSLIQDGVNAPRDMRQWQLSKRLTTAQLATLRTFWGTVQGGLTPFYFYDPYQPLAGHAIGSNYDATGVSTQGRVTCVFSGNWAERTGLGRHEVPQLMMIEVA